MSYNRPDLDLVDSSFFLASSKIFVGLSESPLAFQFKTLTTQFAILLNGDLITSSSHVFTNFESMSLQKNLISRHVLCFYLNGWKVSYFVRQKPVTPAFFVGFDLNRSFLPCRKPKSRKIHQNFSQIQES